MRAVRHAPRPGERRFTGARISGNVLVVATLFSTPESGFQLFPPGCFELRLDGRSRDATIAFRKAVREKCRLASIETMYLRVTADRGKAVAPPMAFKIEAALDLTSGLKVELIQSAKVAAWHRRAQATLPRSHTTMIVRLAQLSDEASQTAAYVAESGDRAVSRAFDLSPAQFASLSDWDRSQLHDR